MRKVYLISRSKLRPGEAEPDYRQLFSPLEARRMGALLKKAVWTSTEALKAAGIEVPEAIVTATDFGCIANSEEFLKAMKGLVDAPMKPTHFMQSTHNTISSLLAIRLKCHGYNATYSHKGSTPAIADCRGPRNSFESAFLDAYMQIALGDIDNALVGWFDETTPDLEAAFPSVAASRAVSMVLSSEGTVECSPENFRELCGN